MNTPSLAQALEVIASHHKMLIDISRNVLRQRAEILALTDIAIGQIEKTSSVSRVEAGQILQTKIEDYYQTLMEAKEDQNPEIAALLYDRELPESLQ